MKKIGLALAALSCFMFANNAFAIDTTELLDKGVVEVAPTIGLINLHKGAKPAWESDIYVGYGALEFMTISTGLSMATDEAFADGGIGLNFDLLFTPLDTENFDIDFHVNFGWGGNFVMTPGLELNFDSDNEMSGFGAFLNLDFPMYSGHVAKNPRDLGNDDDDGRLEEVKTDFTFALSLGLYYTFMEGNQLLAQGGINIPRMAEKLGERRTDGFVAVGYNVEVMENFEIVSEVRIDIPDRKVKPKEDVSAAITVGAIIDLPMM
ncbi:MAG: hypothetical protein J6A01_08205 [Proteobacteria bacterium]|nr:hypothetical protein [Pseudomonadota bacterium]